MSKSNKTETKVEGKVEKLHHQVEYLKAGQNHYPQLNAEPGKEISKYPSGYCLQLSEKQ
jgi:hypothetical protein